MDDTKQVHSQINVNSQKKIQKVKNPFKKQIRNNTHITIAYVPNSLDSLCHSDNLLSLKTFMI